MILAFLLGAATFAVLASLNRDFAIFMCALAMVMVWVREAMQHLARESDRATALRRMREWGLLDG